MNKNIVIPLIICVLLTAIYLFVFSYFRRKITYDVFSAIKSGNKNDLDKILSSKVSNFFLKPFELYRFKLINAAKKGNDKEIIKRYEDFDNLRMNKAEKENIYSDAYFYFVSKGDNECAKKYYNLLEEIGDYRNKFAIECSYNTFIENDYKYLDEALERYNQSNDTAKISLASLISAMYANKGDEHNSKKFDAISKKGLEEKLKK